MSRIRYDRQSAKRSEAKRRQANYDLYVNDLVLGSTPDVAQKFFLSLSPTQQRRIFADPAFRGISWLVRLKEPTL